MPLATLILGFLAGLIVGMVMAAGSWRKALGKLGSYATSVANAPPAKPIAPAAKVLPESPARRPL